MRRARSTACAGRAFRGQSTLEIVTPAQLSRCHSVPYLSMAAIFGMEYDDVSRRCTPGWMEPDEIQKSQGCHGSDRSESSSGLWSLQIFVPFKFVQLPPRVLSDSLYGTGRVLVEPSSRELVRKGREGIAVGPTSNNDWPCSLPCLATIRSLARVMVMMMMMMESRNRPCAIPWTGGMVHFWFGEPNARTGRTEERNAPVVERIQEQSRSILA